MKSRILWYSTNYLKIKHLQNLMLSEGETYLRRENRKKNGKSVGGKNVSKEKKKRKNKITSTKNMFWALLISSSEIYEAKYRRENLINEA